MNASNIAIVIAPNIIWSAEDDGWASGFYSVPEFINNSYKN